MVMLYLMAQWKTALQITLVILAIPLLVMIKEFVSLMQHGQEQYQGVYVS